MTVLITSVGSNTSISAIKALRLSGRSIRIIGTDVNSFDYCAGSMFVDSFHTFPPASKKSEYTQKLVALIREEKINCVIPIHDLEIELIAAIAEQYPDVTFWAVNSPAVIETCNQKVKVNTLLSQKNIHVPTMYKADRTDMTFPVIAKPITGVSSRGIKILKRLEELKDIQWESTFVQAIVAGQEYTVDCYSDYNGIFLGGVVRARIETKDGMSTKGITVEHKELTNACKIIHEALDYRGASNIQFIIGEDGIPYFIEINPRFAGAGILSYKANFNSPLFTLMEAAKETLPLFEDLHIKYGLKMIRYWEECFYEG